MTDFPSFARAHGLLIRDLYADGRIHGDAPLFAEVQQCEP